MAQSQDYGTIFYVVVIVISVVFSIVQALLKGKKIDLETFFKPDKTAENNDETEFTVFDNEPVMVVDAQGNLITKVPPQRAPAPPMKNRRKKRPETVSETVKVAQYKTTDNISDNYIDFIRNNANSAVIMHEILGKPKALQ
jgi:hypothetical protein